MLKREMDEWKAHGRPKGSGYGFESTVRLNVGQREEEGRRRKSREEADRFALVSSYCLSNMLYVVCAVHSAWNTVSLLSHQFSPFKSWCLPDSHQDSAWKNHFLPLMCLQELHVGAAMRPHSHHEASCDTSTS